MRVSWQTVSLCRVAAQTIALKAAQLNASAKITSSQVLSILQNVSFPASVLHQELTCRTGYCGNTLQNGHGPADDGCNMRCSGNSRQFCGGPDRINIYEYVQRPMTTSSSSASSTPSSTLTPTPTPESLSASSSSLSSSDAYSSTSSDHVTSISSADASTSNSSGSSSSSTSTSADSQTTPSSSSTDAHVTSTSSSVSTSSVSSATPASSGLPDVTSTTSSSSSSDISTSASVDHSGVTSSEYSTTPEVTSTASVSSYLNSSTVSNYSSTTFNNVSSTSTVYLNSTTSEALITSTTVLSPNLSSTVTDSYLSTATLYSNTSSSASETYLSTTSLSLNATITASASLLSTFSEQLNITTTGPFPLNSTVSPSTDTPNATITASASLSSSISHDALNTTTTPPFAQNTTSTVFNTTSTIFNDTITASPTDSSTVSLNLTTTATLMEDTIISVTPTPTPTPKVGWFYEGCYVDGPGPRTLPNGQGVEGGMTNQKCRDKCQSLGFVLAGTEYAGECYCGNTLQGVGAPAPDGEAQCNMACNGNTTEICGGPNRLSLFRYYKGNEPPVSSTTRISSSSTAAPVPTGLPAGWDYKGCYVDGPGYRVMQNQQPDDQQMTIASCSSKCASLGYEVAGMEYHTQCFCDNQLRMSASLANSDDECNTPCGGNSAQMCGGGDRLTVYSSQNPLKITPKPGPTAKIGNWTYQGCATSFGGQWNKPLPWKLVNSTGNSPEWCLSKCQAYGYMAAGMEYGEECYCGDVDHMVEKGSVPAPETDCNTPCPGNATAICGQGNRLTWYKYTEGDPLYVFNYPQGSDAGHYEFLVGGPVIPLISIPLINGKVTFLEKNGTNFNGTGSYELDPSIAGGHDIFHSIREVYGLKTDVFCAASITMPDRSGRVINIGGWSGDSLFGIRMYTPNGQLGTNSTSEWQENFQEVSLQTTRWYPTAMMMANGSLLIVGGENGSNGPPVPNMEILPRVGPLKYQQFLLDSDPNNLYPFLAVLPSKGIFIQYWNEARILDETSLDTIKILPQVPGAVNADSGGRTYPLEGTMVLLPQKAPYTDNLEVLICGGSGGGWGLDNCVTTKPDDASPQWTIERMPSRRVMTCMTTLPDGTFMIMNGAEEGVAGFGLADVSNLNAVLYDSRKPKHQRISILGNTTIPRMYHSEAVLMDDGRVLVTGSDPQDDRTDAQGNILHPQEYRYEVYIPPYLASGAPRPAFTLQNNDWTNSAGYQFTVTAGSANIRVSLLGSEASTHGNSMGARILEPAVDCGSFPVCTVTAPPGPYVAPPGWYRMFVLDNEIPSVATWVRIGGDPGSLGNWPNFPDFQPLPGLGPVNGGGTSQAPASRTGSAKFRV